MVVILLAAILCCWQSALSLRQARSQIQSHVVSHHSLVASTGRATVVGILADSNFRVALHALEQRTGVETLAEPEFVTTEGLSAGHLNRSYYDQRFTFTVTNR